MADPISAHHNQPARLGFSIKLPYAVIETPEQLREHLAQSFSQPLRVKHWPWRPQYAPDEWHGHLVGYNVRRFIKAWVHMICSDNFMKSYAFPESLRDHSFPSPYQYLRFLIRGPFTLFPGNHLIDGSGHTDSSPLVFNLYGLPYDNMGDEKYRSNYLVYVRVLQYLRLRDKDVSKIKLMSDLGQFFDRDILEDSLRLLLWTRLIEEKKYGFVYRFKWHQFSDVAIEPDAELSCGDCGRLYLDMLICDYEYVSAMAAVSFQLENQFHQTLHNSDGLHAAEMTLCFLESLKQIIISNLAEYAKIGKLQDFRRVFFAEQRIKYRPFTCGIAGAIKSLSAIATDVPGLNSYIDRLRDLEASGVKAIQTSLQDEN